jgi:hypothetical protein
MKSFSQVDMNALSPDALDKSLRLTAKQQAELADLINRITDRAKS